MLVDSGFVSRLPNFQVRSEQWTTVYIALCGTLVWSVLKGFVSVLVVEADAVANEHTVKMAYLTKYFVVRPSPFPSILCPHVLLSACVSDPSRHTRCSALKNAQVLS